jgi:predicted nucleic acid-binding Zn finger protein
VGYDASEGAYFHRELPFDMEMIETLQPRLKDARALVAEKKVRVTQRSSEGESITATVMVQGTDVEHIIRLTPSGDKCTCPWFSKNLGQRGACKHILAARIAIEGDDTSAEG